MRAFKIARWVATVTSAYAVGSLRTPAQSLPAAGAAWPHHRLFKPDSFKPALPHDRRVGVINAIYDARRDSDA
jgi:hypothetical protein